MSSVDAVPPCRPGTDTDDSDDSVDELITRWQAASRSDGWPADETWWLPEVAEVARLLAGVTHPADGLRAACTDLGTGRAAAGFDLTESRADLKAVLRLAGVDAVTSLNAVDALTLGWIEGTLSAAAGSGSVDPLTRLASRDYLLVRLDELYAAAAKLGGTPAESHELLVVRLRTAPETLVREMRMVLLERALRSVLDGGQTIARLAPNVIVAVVEQVGELNDDRNSLLQAAFEEWLTPEQLAEAPLAWSALPEDVADLPLLLRRILDRH